MRPDMLEPFEYELSIQSKNLHNNSRMFFFFFFFRYFYRSFSECLGFSQTPFLWSLPHAARKCKVILAGRDYGHRQDCTCSRSPELRSKNCRAEVKYEHYVTLRDQVPNNHILPQNLYYDSHCPNPKYLTIGYLDPLGKHRSDSAFGCVASRLN